MSTDHSFKQSSSLRLTETCLRMNANLDPINQLIPIAMATKLLIIILLEYEQSTYSFTNNEMASLFRNSSRNVRHISMYSFFMLPPTVGNKHFL